MNNVDKYYWIINHPKLTSKNCFQAEIELTPHMVNPANDTIEDDKSLNTKQQWWVELSGYNEFHDDEILPFDATHSHYWEMDTGGDTAEEAVDNLYDAVLRVYGDYDGNN